MSKTLAPLTADGNTAATALQGSITVSAAGDFGGGALTVEASFDGGSNYDPLTDSNGDALTLDANRHSANIELGEALVRATLAGSTSPGVAVTYSAIRYTSKL